MSSALSKDNTTKATDNGFSEEELKQFHERGFVIARGLASSEWLDRMWLVTAEHLRREIPPVEIEADVNYPGAPASVDSPGGSTIRRLKQAHARDIVFTEWVQHRPVVKRLQQLLGEGFVMPLAHHNCIMTKQPVHSSDTGWHQDIRYWSYTRPELVSMWTALGEERTANGGLFVIPGSHSIDFDRDRFDQEVFFREDLPENQRLIDQAVPVDLEAGDVLFFHCRTLHAARRNSTDRTKLSAVFTFRPADNLPLPETRSSRGGELTMPSA